MEALCPAVIDPIPHAFVQVVTAEFDERIQGPNGGRKGSLSG